jgi:hypothetical protein
VGAEEIHRHDALTGLALRDVLADLADRAGALVADDVRLGCQSTASPVPDVPSLDRDGRYVDQDVARPALRIGDVLVPEDVRGARLVVHRRFHKATSVGAAPADMRGPGTDMNLRL